MSRIHGWMKPALALAMVLAVASAAQARDVKRCGITIGAGKTGRLVQDVECGYRCRSDATVRCKYERDDFRCPLDNNGCTPERIVLERNATLDLAGFTLRGAYQQTVLACSEARQGRCTVRGPGTLNAPKGQPILANHQNVFLENLTIFGPYDSIETTGWVHASNVSMERCDASIVGGKGVRARDVRFEAGCYLHSGKNLYLQGAVSGDGITAAGNIRAKDVVVRSGGIHGDSVFLRGVQVPAPLPSHIGTFPHVSARKRLVVRDAVLGVIESGRKPTLHGSTCQASRKAGSSESWGVCAGE